MQFPTNMQVVRDGYTLSVSMTVQPDLIYLNGHFVGAPVLAGVVQVGWVIALLEQEFDFKLFFKQLKLVKFTRLIQPNTDITLELNFDPNKLQVKFKINDPDAKCASGILVFEQNQESD